MGVCKIVKWELKMELKWGQTLFMDSINFEPGTLNFELFGTHSR